MNKEGFDPAILESFTLADEAMAQQKLERFAAAGAACMYFLFDFDRTLTTSKHTGDDPTTWQILHGLLPETGQKMSNSIRNKYLALEAAGTLSLEDSYDFSTSVLNLHAAHGTSLQDIERAAKQVRLRDGSQELFAACDAANIPTVILSAGIRDIIELITLTNGIKPSMLISLKLEFSEDGRITGWDKNSLILTHNKHESFKQWATQINRERPFVVLVGDTLEDARMIEGDENVLRIRVCDLKNGECNSEDGAYQRQSFAAGYDMIVEEDLAPVVTLAGWLASQSS